MNKNIKKEEKTKKEIEKTQKKLMDKHLAVNTMEHIISWKQGTVTKLDIKQNYLEDQEKEKKKYNPKKLSKKTLFNSDNILNHMPEPGKVKPHPELSKTITPKKPKLENIKPHPELSKTITPNIKKIEPHLNKIDIVRLDPNDIKVEEFPKKRKTRKQKKEEKQIKKQSDLSRKIKVSKPEKTKIVKPKSIKATIVKPTAPKPKTPPTVKATVVKKETVKPKTPPTVKATVVKKETVKPSTVPKVKTTSSKESLNNSKNAEQANPSSNLPAIRAVNRETWFKRLLVKLGVERLFRNVRKWNKNK